MPRKLSNNCFLCLVGYGCIYISAASKTKNTLALCSLGRITSIIGIGKYHIMRPLALFKLGSDRHMHNVMHFFTTTIDEIQLVGSVTGAMIPYLFISSSFALTSFFQCYWHFPGGSMLSLSYLGICLQMHISWICT